MMVRDHADGAHDENPLDSCPECQEDRDDRKDLNKWNERDIFVRQQALKALEVLIEKARSVLENQAKILREQRAEIKDYLTSGSPRTRMRRKAEER
jgi:hypothetical protein